MIFVRSRRRRRKLAASGATELPPLPSSFSPGNAPPGRAPRPSDLCWSTHDRDQPQASSPVPEPRAPRRGRPAGRSGSRRCRHRRDLRAAGRGAGAQPRRPLPARGAAGGGAVRALGGALRVDREHARVQLLLPRAGAHAAAARDRELGRARRLPRRSRSWSASSRFARGGGPRTRSSAAARRRSRPRCRRCCSSRGSSRTRSSEIGVARGGRARRRAGRGSSSSPCGGRSRTRSRIRSSPASGASVSSSSTGGVRPIRPCSTRVPAGARLAARLRRRSRAAGAEGGRGREPAPQRRGQDDDPAHARPRPALAADGDQRRRARCSTRTRATCRPTSGPSSSRRSGTRRRDSAGSSPTCSTSPASRPAPRRRGPSCGRSTDSSRERSVRSGRTSSRVRVSLPDDVAAAARRPGADRARARQPARERARVVVRLRPGRGDERAGRGDEVVLRVVDHGPGLDGRDVERIFEPFERGTGETKQGTGLGLAIARGFVEANGGRLWAEPVPGRGAVLALALPLADVPARVEA